MGWVRFPGAPAMLGRETSDVFTTVSTDADEAVYSVLSPILGALVFNFESTSWGRCVADCLGVVWPSVWGSCTPTLCTGEGSSF